jgi:hypothetical protein
MIQDGQRWLQDGLEKPNVAQDGFKIVQDDPKMAPESPQIAAIWAQDGLRMGSGWRKINPG